VQMTALASGRRYLSYAEAARYTGLSRWTLSRAHERGNLPVARVGRAVRFDTEDLDRFMAECKR
jgi:excisionase family DNA binding protein